VWGKLKWREVERWEGWRKNSYVNVLITFQGEENIIMVKCKL